MGELFDTSVIKKSKPHALQVAKKNAADEFYTLYEDIEFFLGHYHDDLRDKVLYCNCDGLKSNFVKYLNDHFEEIGIRKLIASQFNPGGRGKLYIRTRGDDTLVEKQITTSGSFDDITLLPQLLEADIVITNPPFSLMRDFIRHLELYKKKFIIVAPHHIVSYSNTYKRFISGDMRIVHAPRSMDFIIPDHYYGGKVDEDGFRRVALGIIVWVTNLPIKSLVEPIVPTKKFSEGEYSRFVNLPDAINIDCITDIPVDFDGVMGVPITYMKYHNAELFDVLGMKMGENGQRLRVKEDEDMFTRFLIKRKS